MSLDGFLAQAKLLCDVAIAATLDDAANYLHLSRRKTKGLTLGRRSLLHQVVQCADQIHNTAAADPIVSGDDGADRAGEVIGKSVFEHDAASANLQRFNDLLRGDGTCQQNNLDGRRT